MAPSILKRFQKQKQKTSVLTISPEEQQEYTINTQNEPQSDWEPPESWKINVEETIPVRNETDEYVNDINCSFKGAD